MGDVGDFWNDVKAARKAAGLPARRSFKRKAVKVAFTAAHREAGWVQHSDWHWQIKLPGGALDYWPSKGKWMFGGVVKQSPFAEVQSFIASNPVASSIAMKRRAKKVRMRVSEPLDAPDTFIDLPDIPEGWKQPCTTCGGGLFWRAQDDHQWTCDNCNRFKGRGLSVNWLTTPAWSAMIERISNEAAS